MRINTFTDIEAEKLTQELELAKFNTKERVYEVFMWARQNEMKNPPEPTDAERHMAEFFIAEVHRRFHYHVVRWLQDMGAELPRR